MTPDQRADVVGRVRSCRTAVAEEVTEAFLQRHPDWVTRYGERARKFGIEDALYHLDFLAGAVESGSPAAFADYARWAAQMLAARGIAPTFLRENLEQIGAALVTRLTGPEHEAVGTCIEAGVAAAVAPAPAGAEPTGPLTQTRDVYLQAVLRGDRQLAVDLLLAEVKRGTATTDLYVDVFQGALYEIGRLWERNQISVAQEHMATAITQYAVARLFPHLPRPARQRGRAVITGVQGELHQVGSNMVADMLEADGWDVHFLGTNTPHEAIVSAVEAHQPRLLGISCTMLFNVPSVVALVKAIRARVDPMPRLIVGGRALRHAPGLCEDLGADGTAADLRGAVELARRLDYSPA